MTPKCKKCRFLMPEGAASHVCPTEDYLNQAAHLVSAAAREEENLGQTVEAEKEKVLHDR